MNTSRFILKLSIVLMLLYFIPFISAQQGNVSEHLQQLNHKEASVRLYGAYALGAIGDAQAVQPLIKILTDPDLYVRAAAVDALGEIGDFGAVDALRGLLEDENHLLRAYAARALAKIVPHQEQEHQIKRYTKDLSDPNRMVRRQAAAALTSLQPNQATVYRRKLATTDLSNADQSIRAEAAMELGEVGNAQSVKSLARVLADKSSFVRENATIALRKIAERLGSNVIGPANKPLATALGDADYGVRHHASEALVLLGAEAVEELISVLITPKNTVNPIAANTLVRIGEPSVGVLAAMLEAGDASARERAVVAGILSQIRPDNAQEYQTLRSLNDLKDSEPSVRRLALNRLGDFGHVTESSRLIAALSDPDAGVRRSAAIALAKIDNPAIDELIPLLNNTNTSIRWHAMMALGMIASRLEASDQLRPAIDSLIDALKDSDSSIRLMAGDTLKRIGIPTSEPIAALLTDENAMIRATAAALLTDLNPAMVSTYQRTRYAVDLRDADASIRAIAVLALGNLGDDSASTVNALTTALNDENSTVRQNAAMVLARIGKSAINALSAILSDSTSKGSRYAILVLGEIAETIEDTTSMRPAVNALIARLNELDNTAAINTLAKIGAPAVGPLVAQLGAPDSLLRSAATKALSQMGDAAVSGLIEALSSGKSTVRQNAAIALGQIAPDEAHLYQATRYINDLKDTDPTVREMGAKMLGYIGDSRAVEALIRALGDSDYRVRLRAAKALEILSDKRAMEPLNLTKKDDVKAVEEAAKKAYDWLKRLP
ncbi:HEAT repeat domain-containing protein [Candidatus Poribacteria bacterium]|nr:HEAT repeat domain-containing protein [Candidatus Poribacteria bacterium]